MQKLDISKVSLAASPYKTKLPRNEKTSLKLSCPTILAKQDNPFQADSTPEATFEQNKRMINDLRKRAERAEKGMQQAWFLRQSLERDIAEARDWAESILDLESDFYDSNEVEAVVRVCDYLLDGKTIDHVFENHLPELECVRELQSSECNG